MSSENHQFIRKYGWDWVWLKEQPENPPTHWVYGASKLLIPRIKVYHE